MARKILLADDSVTAQNMGRRILTDAGYEVTTVNNGSAALKKIAESKPDLIVLDVYMPGYGGLEVCQRLRESDDTARIPVLLTVGKLEPFKVEEVRRVRADAFIIKPFEASELLTALTKLEDKIVPVAQPRKPGRVPKPGSTVDEFMGTAREYGDTETGWKSRLRIPPPHRKSQPEFPEPEPDRSRDVQPRQEHKQEYRQPETDAAPAEAQKAAEELAANAAPKAASGLPSDITMEEIAAIQAAAAAFTTPPEVVEKPKVGGEASREMVVTPGEEKPVAEPETPVTRAASPSQAEVSVQVPTEVGPADPATESSVAREISALSQADTPSQSPVPVEAVTESTPTAASDSAASDQKKLAEHEVAAVLASLEFVNGTTVNSEPDEPFFATIAGAPAREESTGPRWVATAVPLTEEESSLVLEQEMQKALAAMAELSAAESPSVPAVSAVASENVDASAQAPSGTSETKPEESNSVPEAASVEQSVAASESVDAVASAAAADPATGQEQAAYAAAASAGSSVSETRGSVEAVSATPNPTPIPAAEPAEPQRDSDLASAWASWKQIRESVVSPQMTSQIADAAASAASPSVESSASSSTEPPADSASAEPETANGDDTAIASIVDNVLAELKPKLMQEIAKKMSKPKKRR